MSRPRLPACARDRSDPPPVGSDRPIGEVFSAVTADLSTLIRQEVALAKAEIRQSATQAGAAAGKLAGAGVAGHMVLLFVSVSAWWGLGQFIGNAWSALVVAVFWAVVGAVLYTSGRSQPGQGRRPVPHHRNHQADPARTGGPRGDIMTADPDQIRQEIDATREDLSDNVNALADSIKPGNVARRQVDKVKDGASNLKDRVMGAAEDSTAVSVGQRPQTSRTPRVPHRRQFVAARVVTPSLLDSWPSVGWLVASLIPASSAEQQAAAALKDKAQPLTDEVTQAAKDVAQAPAARTGSALPGQECHDGRCRDGQGRSHDQRTGADRVCAPSHRRGEGQRHVVTILGRATRRARTGRAGWASRLPGLPGPLITPPDHTPDHTPLTHLGDDVAKGCCLDPRVWPWRSPYRGSALRLVAASRLHVGVRTGPIPGAAPAEPSGPR